MIVFGRHQSNAPAEVGTLDWAIALHQLLDLIIEAHFLLVVVVLITMLNFRIGDEGSDLVGIKISGKGEPDDRLYLPNSQPLLASLGILKITSSWNEYIWPLIMTNSNRMKTVQLALAGFKRLTKTGKRV